MEAAKILRPTPDIAVTGLLEQVALAVPWRIRMPLEKNYVEIVDAAESALNRLKAETCLPTTFIDRKSLSISICDTSLLPKIHGAPGHPYPQHHRS